MFANNALLTNLVYILNKLLFIKASGRWGQCICTDPKLKRAFHS